MEFTKETGTIPATKRGPRIKYQHLLDMEVADPETGIGEVISYEKTHSNYSKLCAGIIPRYNIKFAPMRWRFALSDDGTMILIQRTA